jgi:hypothetical protein
MRGILITFGLFLLAVRVQADWPRLPAESLDGDRFTLPHPQQSAAWVWIFITPECPVANRSIPAMNRLFTTYSDRGIAFLLIYTDPNQSPEACRQHHQEFQLETPAVRDPGHRLVAFAGASFTPETVVILPDGSINYRGRIDNRFTGFGQSRPQATRHDLEERIQAILEGQPLPFAERPGFGCGIHQPVDPESDDPAP